MPSFRPRVAPGGTPATPPRALSDLLRKADARVIGTDIWTDTDGQLTASIPVPGAAPTTLGTIPSFLIWPTELTVADVCSLTARLDFLTLPSDLGAQILLPFGFLLTATALESLDATAIAAAKIRWSSVYAGANGAAAGTTVVLNSQNNNLDPRTGTASATSATHAIQQMALIERAAVEEGDSFGVVYNSTGPSRHNNGNGDDLTPGWNVFVFLGAGLGRTTGSPMAPVVSLGWGSTPA